MSSVVTFYRFAELTTTRLEQLQTDLVQLCSQRDILGTTLLACEGINGTLAGARTDLEAVSYTHLTLPTIYSV